LSAQILTRDAIEFGHSLQDLVEADSPLLPVAGEIIERRLGGLQRQWQSLELVHGQDPIEAALQVAYIALYAARQIIDDFSGYLAAENIRFRAQNSYSCLQVRGLDVSDQSPLEAGA